MPGSCSRDRGWEECGRVIKHHLRVCLSSQLQTWTESAVDEGLDDLMCQGYRFPFLGKSVSVATERTLPPYLTLTLSLSLSLSLLLPCSMGKWI